MIKYLPGVFHHQSIVCPTRIRKQYFKANQCLQPKKTASNLMRTAVMATSINAILIPCLKSFNQLQEQVEQPGYSFEEEVPSVAWGDELGRLRI